MGKPGKENPKSSTEVSRKRQSYPEKRLAANKTKQETKKLNAKNNYLSKEELKMKRKADRVRNAASRSNQLRQKCTTAIMLYSATLLYVKSS